nr:protein kinase [Kofleriaceae bacterium]
MAAHGDRERFGPFDVFECVGAGGMATVHRATLDVGGHTIDVALKRLLPELADDPRYVAEFIRETRIAAQLEHPNIVHVVELGCLNEIHYIAMELLRGATLVRLLQRAAPARMLVPIPVVIAVIGGVLDALDYAQNGVDDDGERFDLVHRDITPSNVFVTEDGQVKVIDFGVAKTVTGRFATESGLAKGKLAYMAREAISGQAIDARADLYSTGVVAWELIAGRRLFPEMDDWVVATRDDAVDPPSKYAPKCPRELDAVVLRALTPARDARWPTAAAMRDALLALPFPRAATADVAMWMRSVLALPASADPSQPGQRPRAAVVSPADAPPTAKRRSQPISAAVAPQDASQPVPRPSQPRIAAAPPQPSQAVQPTQRPSQPRIVPSQPPPPRAPLPPPTRGAPSAHATTLPGMPSLPSPPTHSSSPSPPPPPKRDTSAHAMTVLDTASPTLRSPQPGRDTPASPSPYAETMSAQSSPLPRAPSPRDRTPAPSGYAETIAAAQPSPLAPSPRDRTPAPSGYAETVAAADSPLARSPARGGADRATAETTPHRHVRPPAETTATSVRLATSEIEIDIEEPSDVAPPIDDRFPRGPSAAMPVDERFPRDRSGPLAVATPFDVDDRFALDQPSPFASADDERTATHAEDAVLAPVDAGDLEERTITHAEDIMAPDDDPAAATAVTADPAHAATQLAPVFTPSPFDFEPTAPSKEMIVTFPPPPRDEFDDPANAGVTRNASIDTAVARRFEDPIARDTDPTAQRPTPMPPPPKRKR